MFTIILGVYYLVSFDKIECMIWYYSIKILYVTWYTALDTLKLCFTMIQYTKYNCIFDTAQLEYINYSSNGNIIL